VHSSRYEQSGEVASPPVWDRLTPTTDSSNPKLEPLISTVDPTTSPTILTEAEGVAKTVAEVTLTLLGGTVTLQEAPEALRPSLQKEPPSHEYTGWKSVSLREGSTPKFWNEEEKDWVKHTVPLHHIPATQQPLRPDGAIAAIPRDVNKLENISRDQSTEADTAVGYIPTPLQVASWLSFSRLRTKVTCPATAHRLSTKKFDQRRKPIEKINIVSHNIR
jgi:hypothetical protein